MAKLAGKLSAIYLQDRGASTADTGAAMTQEGSTLWYRCAVPAWDRSKAVTIYDSGSAEVPAEIDYAGGRVLLSATATGAITADFYHFALVQVGGFRSHEITENMNLVECGCYEDGAGEDYVPTQYGATISGEGFYSTIDASLTTDQGANANLTLTSKVLGDGPAHDGVSAASIECVVSGNDTPLTVDVVGSAITINSATGPAGAATSTAREIRDAIMASEAASALVKVKIATGSDGSGVFGAMAHAHMTGGVDPSTGVKASYTSAKGSYKDIKFEAQTAGIAGNSITVTVTTPAGDNALACSVSGSDITVVSATTGGAGTSTAQEICDKINSTSAAFALIKAEPATVNDGSGVFGALSKTNLAGGIADGDPDRWGEDLIGVFYWDTGAALTRTEGVVVLEKASLKTGNVKDLVGKNINMKVQGMLYDTTG